MSGRRVSRLLVRGTVRRVSYLGIGIACAVSRLFRKTAVPAEIRRILVCRIDLLGDLLFTRPLVHALRERYPGAHITLLTLPYTEPLAALYHEVDRVVTVDTNAIRTPRGFLRSRTWVDYVRTLRLLRSERFDLGISVCGRTASLCIRLAGVRRSIGYEREAYPFSLDVPVPGGRYVDRKHEVEYSRTLAGVAGATAAPERLHLRVPNDAIQAIEARLSMLGVRPEDRLVVIHAGAVNGSAKRWPPRYWAGFADRIIESTGARVVLIGAGSDLPLSEVVLQYSSFPVLSLVGETSLVELFALIRRADLVASGDSGPLHVAIALGRPLVAAYGPTDPVVHGPYGPVGPYRVHRADIPCSPCYSMAATADCPLGDPICMRLVTVEQMVRSAVELLQARATGEC